MDVRLRFTAMAMALVWATTAPAQEQRRPNVVFVLVDDLGYSDLGCYGSSFYETPNIDALAGRGARFTQAYAAGCVCSPTRASILSGKHPARLHNTDYFGGSRRGRLLPAEYDPQLALEEVTLAEALRDAGYRTAFFGKWHLGGESFRPENQGFDVNVGGHAAGHPASYFHPFARDGGSPFDVPDLEGGEPGDYLTDRLTSEAIDFLDECADAGEPFLLYLSFYAVHTPLQAKPDVIARFEEKAAALPQTGRARFVPEGCREARQVQDHAVYAAMVSTLDDNVGRLLARLEERGLDEETIVVFTSDNGGLSTSEGSPTSNLPLRAGKGWLYEGGIREPLIIAGPGIEPSLRDVSVISTDLYPTLLELTGSALLPRQHVDGVSLAPLLRGAAMPNERALFWHYPHYGNQGGRPAGAVRHGDLKLIEFFEDGRRELYDLAADAGELHDLAAQRSADVRRLAASLASWRVDVDAAMPRSNPDFRPPAPRALIIGDSISRGYSPMVKERLLGKVEVLQIPINGGATSRGVERLEEWVGRGAWDVIHFNFGLHDLCYRDPTKGGSSRDKVHGRRMTTPDEYERNLRAIVDRLQRTGATLIWASTTPVPEGEPGRIVGDELELNRIAAAVMAEAGVAVNDLHGAVVERFGELATRPGDVHFSRGGSSVLADRVAAAIESALATSGGR